MKKIFLVILVTFAFNLMASDTSYGGEYFTNEKASVSVTTENTRKISYSEVEKMYLEDSVSSADRIQKNVAKKNVPKISQSKITEILLVLISGVGMFIGVGSIIIYGRALDSLSVRQ